MEIRHQAPFPSSTLPAYVPRFNRSKPVIAVVGDNHFTELTDYVVPYGVLAESGVANVLAIATQKGPMRMFPALQIEPQATIAEFDTQFPEGADYVVVPTVAHAKEPILLTWLNQQAEKGATIVGICDGAWVLANAGLLAGRQGVGHWFSVKRLAKKFPDTQWLRNRRYVADGNVITTTGISASIPVSVALVEAIAGQEQATALAQRVGIQHWGAEHQSGRFKLRATHIFTAVINWFSFWTHETVGVPINDEVDEIALALITDAYSRTFRSKVVSLMADNGQAKTKHSLVILSDKATHSNKKINREIALKSDTKPVSLFDRTLQEIEQFYGVATARFIALQLEYSAYYERA
ncbi:DJ-1/PfpI family protein [Vacuolonema iberomarrocanum]|uniref:DJ-1/PfpI family protein n=1 Tax=Vacuolonema iberomarrocanum TaxID=3454632 RepID=UPI001A0B80A3|nr:DJ-1/PfpI family protein [filamentous cyanobacterium LEGE 07170]